MTTVRERERVQIAERPVPREAPLPVRVEPPAKKNRLPWVILGAVAVVGLLAFFLVPRPSAADKTDKPFTQIGERALTGTLKSAEVDAAVAASGQLPPSTPNQPVPSAVPETKSQVGKTGNWKETLPTKYGLVEVDYKISGAEKKSFVSWWETFGGGYISIHIQNATPNPAPLVFVATWLDIKGKELNVLKINKIIGPNDTYNIGAGMPGATDLTIRVN